MKKLNTISQSLLNIVGLMFVWLINQATGQTVGQQIIFRESFGPRFPAGWTQEVADSTSRGWSMLRHQSVNKKDSVPSQFFLPTTNNTTFAMSFDWLCKDCNKSNDILITPKQNFSQYDGVMMDFRYVFFQLVRRDTRVPERFQILAKRGSIGAAWDTVANVGASERNEWSLLTINLNPYAGDTAVWIGFRYSDGGQQLMGAAIDDVLIYAPPQRMVSWVRPELPRYMKVGDTVFFAGVLRNIGYDTIRSVEYRWQLDNDPPNRITIDTFVVSPARLFGVRHNRFLVIRQPKSHYVRAWIESINGHPVPDSLKSVFTKVIIGASFIPEKRILLESMTGAWCGFCPEGHLQQDYAESVVPNVINVSIHVDDVMQINNPDLSTFREDYQRGVPSGVIDRKYWVRHQTAAVSPSLYAPLAYTRSNDAVPVELDTQLRYLADSRDVIGKIKAKFYAPDTGDFRFVLLVIEDSIRSLNSAYDQQNYYSKNSQVGLNATTHPFYNLPPVIKNYVHRHVLRLAPFGLWGRAGEINTIVKPGDTAVKNINYRLTSQVRANQVTIVGMVVRYSPDLTKREVLNAEVFSVKNILLDRPDPVQSTSSLGYAAVYPNPTDGELEVSVQSNVAQTLKLWLTDLAGRVVQPQTTVNMGTGLQTLPFTIEPNITNGIYLLHIQNQTGETLVRKIVLTR